MGTKNNPGSFDCYAAAEPDEPMFILLARDRHAAALVRIWALLREAEGEDTSKVKEAFKCARDMDTWAMLHDRKPMSLARISSRIGGLLRRLRT